MDRVVVLVGVKCVCGWVAEGAAEIVYVAIEKCGIESERHWSLGGRWATQEIVSTEVVGLKWEGKRGYREERES